PWAPFLSQADFDFAEYATINRLSDVQIDDLLKRMRKLWASDVHISMQNARDVHKSWDQAASIFPTFEKKTFTASYESAGKNVTQEFEIHTRSPKDWICELVEDKHLAGHIQWYPVKKYKCEDGKEIHFFDEPLTATDCHDAQDALPEGACAIHLSIYSDATQIARFNGKSFHPVVGRVLNISDEKRNVAGHGGGTLLGYIPNVVDNEEGSAAFANFKREVLHRSLDIVLDPLVIPSKVGHTSLCGDEETRTWYPRVAILSSDFEEQADLSLTRGVQAKFPCPVCLVPHDEQHDLSLAFTYPERTAAQSEATYNLAQNLLEQPWKKGEAESVLKEKSLRNNAFWRMYNSCPHRALSYDVLHFIESGFWGKHMWVEFLGIIEGVGSSQATCLYHERVRDLPRWPGLPKFDKITNVKFADGNKYLSILKIILPTAHDLVPVGSQSILKVIREVASTRMFAGLSIQTQERVEAGRGHVCALGAGLEACFRGREVDFPKAHAYVHLFSHIVRKGVTKNYNTKLGEAMHIGLKDTYEQTNRKEFEGQVGPISVQAALSRIRFLVDEYEKQEGHSLLLQEGGGFLKKTSNLTHALGSKHSMVSPERVGEVYRGERGHRGFRKSLDAFLLDHAQAAHLCPGGTQTVELGDNEMITVFNLLRVNFTSLDDWQPDRDVLRCNQTAYGTERADCVQVKTTLGVEYFRLQLMFTCIAFGREWEVAWVTPFSSVQAADISPIGMEQVKEEKKTQFILIENIIRGAYISPDFGQEGLFFVNDLMDYDMFLRLHKF
ncbi:hypothetical protein BOTBODRAFT_97965, partial [Botryobasidium botryosum FD-172 SS1]